MNKNGAMRLLFILSAILYLSPCFAKNFYIDSLIFYKEDKSIFAIRTFNYNNRGLLEREEYKRLSNNVYKPIYCYRYSYDFSDREINSTLHFYKDEIPYEVSRTLSEYKNDAITKLSQQYDKYKGWINNGMITYNYTNDLLMSIEDSTISGFVKKEFIKYNYDKTWRLVQASKFNRYNGANEILEDTIYNYENDFMKSRIVSFSNYGTAYKEKTEYISNDDNIIEEIKYLWKYIEYIPESKIDFLYTNGLLKHKIRSKYKSDNTTYLDSGELYEYDEWNNILSVTYQTSINAYLENKSRYIWKYDENRNAILNSYQIFYKNNWINSNFSEDNVNFYYNNSNNYFFIGNKHNTDISMVNYCSIKYKDENNNSIMINPSSNNIDIKIMGNRINITSEYNINCMIINLSGNSFMTDKKEFSLENGIYILNINWNNTHCSKKIIINSQQ